MLGESGSKLAAFSTSATASPCPPQGGQMPAVPLVPDRVARAKLDSSRELPPGRLPVPVEVVQAKCERDVSFAESTVQRYGLGRRRLRFRIRSSVCKMSSLSSHSVKARVSRIRCCRVHSLQAWRFTVCLRPICQYESSLSQIRTEALFRVHRHIQRTCDR